MTPYAYTDERGSRLVVSRAPGMVFYFTLLFTILISILRIEYTYEWSSRELKDALRLHGKTGAQNSSRLTLPVFFFVFYIYMFCLLY
jgi:hypothetical protein